MVIGSFGSSDAYDSPAFKLSIERDPDLPVPSVEAARYGKQPEIHHIFKDDPTSPPVVITLAFVAMVGATLPVLGGLVRMFCFVFLSRKLMLSVVALPGRQCQPPSHRTQGRSFAACYLPRLFVCIRGYLLPLLHFVELVPDSARRGDRWRGRIRERQPRIGRSAGTAPCWAPVNVWSDAVTPRSSPRALPV